MKVEDLKNYSKDIISIQNNFKLPLKSKFIIIKGLIIFAFKLILEFGPIGFIRFFKQVKSEKVEAMSLDWNHVLSKGISLDNLSSVVEKQVVAKIMVEKLGYEKAARIRNQFSNMCSYYIFEEIFAKPEEFIECGKGDFLVAFKKYYIALEEAMKRVGLEDYEVGIDTKDCFQMNITFCAYHEVAKTLGNSMNCYYSTCYGDEVYFPKLCEKVGFNFKREGTLATGKSCCDMTFTRKQNSRS